MAEGNLQSLRNALWDNADFEEVGSVEKAKAYVTAATRWIALVAASSSDQGSSMSMAIAETERLMQRARSYTRANDHSSTRAARSSGVRFLSAGRGFRR